jgi:hypothetical protein
MEQTAFFSTLFANKIFRGLNSFPANNCENYGFL